jgi:hypothetical protein
MANWFNVGVSTIRKYVDIVCNVVIDKNMVGSSIGVAYMHNWGLKKFSKN